MNRFCGNCFNETLDDHMVCMLCKFDSRRNREKAPHALPAGTILNGRYIIGRILGQGGFGITYTARDHHTGQLVAVKEFFPDSMVTRIDHSFVAPFSGERGENFGYGKESFLHEAETMAKFIGNPNIVRVYSYFEENGTAYFVMEYVDGVSLQSYIKSKGGRIHYEEAIKILLPVMDALSVVHEKGIIHRDVAPDNIYISNDGTIKLLDFGAARYSLGNVSRSLDVILKHGFAPKEQYKRRGRQGPYTDVYSLGATLYYSITGVRPDDAIERSDEDEMPYPSSLNVQITPQQEDVLLKALAVNYEDRFQTMAEFRKAVLTASKKPDFMSKIQEELRRLEELRRQEEERRRQEELRKQEEERRRQEELRRQEEERRKQEELRKQEEERRRQEELRKLEEERRRQEELRKQEEERRKQEELRKQEEERRRQEELRRQEEERRKQEELRRQEETRRKQEEQRKQKELQKQKNIQKQQEANSKKSPKWLVPVLAIAAVAFILLIPKFITQPDSVSLSVPETTPTEIHTENTTAPSVTETYLTETVPTEIQPEPTDATEPQTVPEGGPNGELYFVTSETANTLTITGKDLSITVVDDKDVTVTLSGLELQDSYSFSKSTSNTLKYNWSVAMYSGDQAYQVATIGWAYNPDEDRSKTPQDFQHSLWVRFDEESWDYLKDVKMEYTSDSVTWTYSINTDCYFDFQNVLQFIVSVQDGSQDLHSTQTYIPKEKNAASNETNSTQEKTVSTNPNAQQVSEEDLSFKSNAITPVRMRETGYSLHSAKFLDKPVSNCLSLTAEIKVKEGTPKEFIVYLQDLDKWYEAGRIKATGEDVMTGTVSFSKPIAFNAFAIVPSEGDYATSISYKLVSAEIKGGPLSSVTTDDSIVFSEENLTVEVKNNRDVTVTVSGLELLDEYPSYVSGGKGTEEYRWSVYMTSGDNYLSLRTDCPVPVKKFNKPKITKWENMSHTLRLGRFEFGELDNHVIKDMTPTVTHTADSITWTFKLDKSHPFDFTTGITVKVDWFDRANHKQNTLYYYGS